RFNDEISSIQWNEIVFTNGWQSRRVALPEAAMNGRLDALNHAARNGKDFTEFINAIDEIGEEQMRCTGSERRRDAQRSHRLQASVPHSAVISFPLDRARRYARNVITDAVDAFDFVTDSSG